PREARRREQAAPPGVAALADRPRLLHQLPAQTGAERVVDRRLGPARRHQHRRQAAQLLVLEGGLELGVVVRAHSTGLRLVASSRRRVTPRWISSFTAPAVLPIATAMSSIFMSSWNLSTSAVRC